MSSKHCRVSRQIGSFFNIVNQHHSGSDVNHANSNLGIVWFTEGYKLKDFRIGGGGSGSTSRCLRCGACISGHNLPRGFTSIFAHEDGVVGGRWVSGQRSGQTGKTNRHAHG